MGGETGILRGGETEITAEWRGELESDGGESERDNTKEEENEWRDGGSSLEISMTINCCLTAALIKVSLQRLSAAPHRCCICAARMFAASTYGVRVFMRRRVTQRAVEMNVGRCERFQGVECVSAEEGDTRCHQD